MTKKEQIEAINASFESTMKEINDRRNYRSQNYYNCIDDYSEFGPCAKADDALENSARKYRDLRIEEVNNNGVHQEISKAYVLLDKDGKILSDGVHCWKWGLCWYDNINGVYVGVPKKLSTLTKKGYRLALLEKRYDCKVKEVKLNGHVMNSSMKFIVMKTTDCHEIPENIGTVNDFSDWQYEEFFEKVA